MSRTDDPLSFLGQLECDWQAAMTCAPGRDRRLDGLVDEALITILVRVGKDPDEARRHVADVRRELDARPTAP